VLPPQAAAPAAPRSRVWRRREATAGYLFALPAFVLHLGFVVIPAIGTLAFAVSNVDMAAGSWSWVGLENFTYIFTDPRFWKTLGNTFLFVCIAEAGNVGFGLLLAVLLDRKISRPFLYVMRLAYFLPVLVAPAFVSFVWKFLYSTDLGVFNYYLRELGLPGVGWLTDSHVALLSVALMDVWKYNGFFMIILLAALQAVPREIIEAASLDGASPRQVFWHVKAPLISPVILFCISYATITGLQAFDSMKILTSGGPGDATRSTVMYMYEQSFDAQDMGAGAATAFSLLAIVALVAGLQYWLLRGRVHV
jgi:multiple sugar transport system permease protein